MMTILCKLALEYACYCSKVGIYYKLSCEYGGWHGILNSKRDG